MTTNLHLYLAELSITDAGLAQISSAFGDGSKLLGFAIDPETLEYYVGGQGDPHARAKSDLMAIMLPHLSDTQGEFLDRSIVCGWIATVEWCTKPLVLLGTSDRLLLRALEQSIRDRDIGLPVSLLYVNRKSPYPSWPETVPA